MNPTTTAAVAPCFSSLCVVALFLLQLTRYSDAAAADPTRLVRLGYSDVDAGNPNHPPRKLGWFCLGLFQDCDETDEGTTDTNTNTTDESGGGGTTDGGWFGEIFDGNVCISEIFQDCEEGETGIVEGVVGGVVDLLPCIGWFQDCDDDTDDSTNNSTNTTDVVDCSQYDEDSFLLNRPLFGPCSFIDQIFNPRDTDGDGEADPFFDFDGEDWSLGLFPEGGFLWQILNRDSDKSLIEAILDSFTRSTNSFTNSFLEEWAESANFINVTCNVSALDDAPACLDVHGNFGQWGCRTLTNPYSGQDESKNVCIADGEFLDGNDECGCCEVNGVQVCPEPCQCTCSLWGTGDGVLINVATGIEDITIPNRCVDPASAVSLVSRFNSVTCETCAATSSTNSTL